MGSVVKPTPTLRSSTTQLQIISVVLPIVLIGMGLLSVWQQAALQPAVDAYRAASPCGTAVATGACYTLPVGTVTSLTTSRNRSTVYTNLQLQLPDGMYPARLTNLSDESLAAVLPGASLRVQLYQRAISLVQVRGVWLTTTANPVFQQRQASGGTFFLAIGIMLALLRFFVFLAQRLVRRRAVEPPMPAQPAPAAPALPDPAGSIPLVLPLIVRPRLTLQASLLVPALSVALLIAAMYLRIRPRGDGAEVFWLAATGLTLAGVVLLWLYFRNTTVFVDDLNVGTTDLLGRQRIVARSDAGRMALRTVLGARSRNSRRILLLGADGRTVLRMYGQFFSLDDLRTLAGVLRVPIDSDWGPGVTAGELRTEFPGSASWLETHGSALGIGAGLLVMIAVFYFVLGPGR